MSNSTEHANASYHWWSRVIAIVLAILLALLWWIGYGPSGANRVGCCGYQAAAVATPVVSAAAAASATAAAVGAATVSFENGKVTINGTVGSDSEKQQLLAAAAKAYGAGNVIDAITITRGLAPLGGITLTGQVPSEAKKLTDGAAAITAFAPAKVDNQLTVAIAVATAVSDDACAAALKADVGFATGSSQLSSAGKKALDAMAACLKNGGTVVGHTDNVGKPASNQALSERRAKATAAYLAGKGVSNIRAKGMGDTQPAADNASAEGRAKNRRMDITAQ
jgi:outer membrane protein OmpA-like peptidoglycan-associated protein